MTRGFMLVVEVSLSKAGRLRIVEVGPRYM